MNWLNGDAFTVLGQTVLWSDMIGNLLGLAALALGWRRSMATWPVQLLSGVVLVSANIWAQLGGGVGKQAVIIVMAVWGWRQWRHGRQDGDSGRVAIRFATWRERGLLVLGTAVGTAAVAGLFLAFPVLSWNAWPDAYIFVGTLAAMVAQARGWVEFWFAWLAVDLVGIPLAFSSGLPFSGLVYGVYLVLVLAGLRSWWLQGRRNAGGEGAAVAGSAGPVGPGPVEVSASAEQVVGVADVLPAQPSPSAPTSRSGEAVR